MTPISKEEREKADIAQVLYDMRKREGLTQKQLADLVGTTPSVISRLEDADIKAKLQITPLSTSLAFLF